MTHHPPSRPVGRDGAARPLVLARQSSGIASLRRAHGQRVSPANSGEFKLFGALAPIALIVGVGACGAGSPAPAGEAHPLAWLVGSWEAREADTVTTESWTLDEGGALDGLGQTRTTDGSVVHNERMRIDRRGARWIYAAAPVDQEATEFELVRVSDHEAVFENLAHDFPKRIAYARVGDVLTATISGDADQRTASWTFTRSPAPTSASPGSTPDSDGD